MNRSTLKLPTPNQVSIPVPDADSILVVPLGGTDRVGMNFTAYGTNGRWVLVDMGATFPGADDDQAADFAEEHEAEVDQIIPDPRSFQEILRRLDAIVLTHAHEDHIGAIAPLLAFSAAWPKLATVPIYGTPYTLGIVKNKLREIGRSHPLRTIYPKRTSRIGQFEITPIRVTHSAPETMALSIAARPGRIVHASDFKLDEDPVLGGRTDYTSLQRIGDHGVLAFMGDSTNAHLEGKARTEGEVLAGLTSIMQQHKGRVVVSTFASNLARIEGIRLAAKRSGRHLAASGLSISRNIENAKATGVLSQTLSPFLDGRRLPRGIAPDRLAMVCTGTQAEERSALRRMADDLELGRRTPHGAMRLEEGDMVIHSARAIPGNEATIGAMFDVLRSHGVIVIDAESGYPIHASGHGRRGDLADMYRMLQPRFALPIHGTRTLVGAHADLAASMKSVEGVATPSEGEILRISRSGITCVGRMEISLVAVMRGIGASAGKEKLAPWPAGREPVLVRNAEPFRRSRPSAPRSDIAPAAPAPSM